MARSKVRRKAEFDREIAADLGYSYKTVSGVTQALVEHLRSVIAAEGGAYLDGLGRFTLRISAGGQRIVLTKGTFKKGEKAGKVIREVPFKIHVDFAKAASFKAYLAESVQNGGQHEPRKDGRGNEQVRRRRGS